MKKAECLDKQDLLLYRVRQKNSPRQHYDFCYSVLHQFRQAEFAYGGSIFSLIQF
jgi:hypothetical protein